MEPVKVKVYGIFSVTKAKYIGQLILTVVLSGAMLFAWQAVPRPRGRGVPQEFEKVMWWMDHVPYLLGGLLFLLAVEAFFVFRAFARKEAAQRAELAAKEQASASLPSPSEKEPAVTDSPPEVPSPTQPEPLTPPS